VDKGPTSDDPGALRERRLQREIERRILVEDDLNQKLTLETEKVADQDRLLRLFIASVQDYAIFLLDPKGYITSWNPGAERLKQYAAHEILGEHFSIFYPRSDVDAGKCEHELVTAMATGSFEDEGWRVRKDGSRFWANVVITALRGPTGHLVGFGKVTRDLTAHKAADDERERFRLFVETVEDYAMFILDPTGHVTTWNRGAERIKGYRAHEIIGRHFSTFYPESDIRAGKCELELERAARDGRVEDEDWRIRKDGTQFWANVVITAIRDQTGELIGFSKVTRDLTGRKSNEDERAARLAAEQANRAKDEFLAMLGHELRTPLAPMLTALQLIKLHDEPRLAKEHQVIERQVQHMTHLVDDMLDVSRIVSGKIELVRRPLDVRQLLARASEIASPIIEAKGHRFELSAPSQPLVVEGDESRLVQVFANLLNNAAKYTDPGGNIVVRVFDAESEISVEVRDDGIGICQELLPKVFDLFIQASTQGDRGTGGLGLGLTIVRSLVQLHGGRVEVQSPGPQRGSRFIVHLPSAHSGATDCLGTSPLTSLTPVATPRRILLVDDHEDARLLLAELLQTLGHHVLAVEDGPEALAAVEDFDPDVALLDIGLPGMDGYEVARRIRQTAIGDSVRLIALTGYGLPEERAHGQDAGFDRHLVKPVDMSKLLQTISELTAPQPNP